jgi:hypothetical protein
MTASYMGIEFCIDGEWVLAAAAQMDYQQALAEAPKVAEMAGYSEYRVRRLTEEECMEQVRTARENPIFTCPRCNSLLLPGGEDMRQLCCEVCGLETTYEAISGS